MWLFQVFDQVLPFDLILKFKFQSQSLPLKEKVFALFYDEGHKLLEQQDPMCAHYYSEFQSFEKHLEDVDKLADLIVRWNKLDYWKSVFKYVLLT